MGLTRWILALCGYVRLEVSGVHPERVLNACAAAGIACTASEPVDAYTLRITVRARCADTVTELADERGLDLLKQYGYLPCDKEESRETVAKGLEYALADWCEIGRAHV